MVGISLRLVTVILTILVVITHEPAGEVNIIPYAYDNTAPGKPGALPSYASVKFSQTSITVAAGQSAVFVATFTPPKDIPDNYLPVYSGFIKITNNNDEFRVAYLGQPYSRYNAKYIDTTDKYGEGLLPAMISYDENWLPTTINDIATFNFGTGAPGQGYPYLQWITQQSIQYFTIEIVPYNTTFKPDHYGFNRTASNPDGVPSSALPLVYPNLKINATIAGSDVFGLFNEEIGSAKPSLWLYYLDSQILDFGGGSLGQLPLGDYRALLRILRWKGDWRKEEAWESWLSPVIRLRREGEGGSSTKAVGKRERLERTVRPASL